MFPGQDNTIQDNSGNNSSEIYSSGKSFLFDFSTGDFVTTDGKITEINGIEALKLWIIKVLKTEKSKFKIYDKDYGATLLEVVNSDYPYAFIKAEIEKEITEVLLKNNSIKSLINFEFIRDKRTLIVSFTVNTIYGQVESEVII